MPIVLLILGFFLILTAYAAAAPGDVAKSEVCAVTAAQAQAEPSGTKVHCWKKIAADATVSSCSTERAILAEHDGAAPALAGETVFFAHAAALFFIDAGFDPPPPKA